MWVCVDTDAHLLGSGSLAPGACGQGEGWAGIPDKDLYVKTPHSSLDHGCTPKQTQPLTLVTTDPRAGTLLLCTPQSPLARLTEGQIWGAPEHPGFGLAHQGHSKGPSIQSNLEKYRPPTKLKHYPFIL